MIESLNSPHVARVKALIGSRGVKERKAAGQFVAEGLQCAREALVSTSGPKIETLYVTNNGHSKVEELADLSAFNIVTVSDEVMKEMSETITPQGILAVCTIPQANLSAIALNGSRRFIYLSEVQDPGNAGTILRSADAFAMDAVITSPGSVDMYSPKVVRSTAGSLWHIPVYESVALTEVLAMGVKAFSLGADGYMNLNQYEMSGDTLAVFGNEARGLSTGQNVESIDVVSIPMPGNAESLNLSAAASIVMYHLSNMPR
ncbi:MAG: RNA methyltransferase [Actinomycetes bacterium]|jgi:TrmH family RNA methyltransferase